GAPAYIVATPSAVPPWGRGGGWGPHPFHPPPGGAANFFSPAGASPVRRGRGRSQNGGPPSPAMLPHGSMPWGRFRVLRWLMIAFFRTWKSSWAKSTLPARTAWLPPSAADDSILFAFPSIYLWSTTLVFL